MDDEHGGGHSTRSDETKDRAIEEYLETPPKIKYFGAILKLAQEKGLQVYQTRSHAVVLYNTLLAACIEKAGGMYENTGSGLPEGSLNCDTVSYWNWTRNLVTKIYKAKTQDHLGNHQAIRKVAEKLCNNTVENKYLEYLFLQSSSRIQHARTRSRGWSRSSRTTNIRNYSFRDLSQTQKINKFSKESQDLTAPRSSNFAKILPNSYVLTAMPTGK